MKYLEVTTETSLREGKKINLIVFQTIRKIIELTLMTQCYEN